MTSADEDLRNAMSEALERLALQLGGTTDTGGPVEHATQIKERGDLGVLLTDVRGFVLGRVWLEFGGAAKVDAGDAGAGSVGVTTFVRAETVTPPVSVDEWMKGR